MSTFSSPVFIPDNLKQFVKIKESKCKSLTILTYTVIPTNPDGVIPKRYSYNVLDDNTYVKYPDLIKLIPRGLSVLLDNDGNEICRLDGLQKFDGSCPLDNDDDVGDGGTNSTDIFKQSAADILNWEHLKVEFLEKANGKMAIFKVFKFNNEYFIFGGSKNVHIVVGINEEIKESILHHQILKQFQLDIADMDISKIVDQTIIGEYVDGQHIVYVDKAFLIYFSGNIEKGTINKLLPDQNTLPTPEQLTYLRNLENTEGTVIVYTNLDTGVVFRQKHKSIWYILIRVMREGLRHFTKQIPTEFIVNKVYSIFEKRSNDFLNLSEVVFTKWYLILKNFVMFVKWSEYEFSDLDMQKIGIGLIFHKFINCDHTLYLGENNGMITNGTNGILNENGFIYQEPLVLPGLVNYIEKLYSNGIKVCIIMRGVSGSGKTNCVKILSKLFDESAFSIFSTDNFFMINGEYKFDPNKLKLYHDNNFQNFEKATLNNIQITCVDNTNLTNEYKKYTEFARNHGYVVVVLDCIKLSPEVLVARSTHNVPIRSIITKLSGYNYTDPIYYGIFFNTNVILKLINEYDNGYVPKQTTPFHITLFYGKNEFILESCKSIDIGKQYAINVISLCTSKAGRFLKVTSEQFENSHKNLHITLETFDGFKPADVGKYPADKSIDTNKNITGVIGPIY